MNIKCLPCNEKCEGLKTDDRIFCFLNRNSFGTEIQNCFFFISSAVKLFIILEQKKTSQLQSSECDEILKMTLKDGFSICSCI